jgi:membrane protease YdiL (CAAX protease family)
MATTTAPTRSGTAAPTASRQGAPWRTSVTAVLHRHAVLAYFVLVLALTWGALLAVIRGPVSASGADPMANPLFVLAILAGPLVPTAAGLLLMGLLEGRAGDRELLGRLRRWRVGWRWYAAALLAGPLPILLATALLAALLRSPAFLPGIFTASVPLGLVLVGVAAGLVAGVFEEVGWTGFAVPRLRRRHSLLTTSLLVGLVWGAWHGPAFWRADSFSGALPFALLLAQLFAWLPAYRVLLVAAHDRTASLPVAMLMHAGLSASAVILAGSGLSDAQSLASVLTRAALLWAAAGAVVLADRRRRAPLGRAVPMTALAEPPPACDRGERAWRSALYLPRA